MKDITKTKSKLEVLYAKKYCGINNVKKCPREHCTCQVAAEIKAYINSILPSSCSPYSIFDFDGRDKEGERLISSKKTIEIKNKLLSYCWKGIDAKKLKKLTPSELDKFSIINGRLKQGKNVIIHGGQGRSTQSARGKSFIASLILKEAIKQRSKPNCHSHSYDWISFNQLKEKIKNSDDDLSSIKYCDWLVVDDIARSITSRKGQNYIASIIDPFFQDRIKEDLPTIMVCRFDVNKSDKSSLEEEFGIALASIMKSKSTFKINVEA